MEGLELYANACRACLKNDGIEPYLLTEDNLDTMFEITTNIQISPDDGFPKLVCKQCLDLIKVSYNFRLQCNLSNDILKQCCAMKIEMKLNDDIDINDMVEIKLKEEVSEHSMHAEANFRSSFRHSSYSKVKIWKKNPTDDGKIKRIKIKKIKNTHIKNFIDSSLERSETSQTNTEKSIDLSHYNCGICKNNTCDSFGDLKLHLQTHKTDKSCQNCNTLLVSWSELLCHRYRHLPVDIYICHLCEKQIRGYRKLGIHIRNEHFHKQAKYCEICNKDFSKRAYLYKHIKNVHLGCSLGKEKLFTCDICFKIFKTISNYKSHYNTHSRDKKFICDDCGFSCNFRVGILSHISRRHEPNKNLKCLKCSKIFKTKLHLAEHTRSEHTYEKSICTICGKAFGRKMLRRHMLSHSNERPFSCLQCTSKFKSADQLAIHKRSHTGERPYQCKYCSNTFSTQGVLIKHTRIHTGEKPFICDICGKGFTAKYNLKVHMRVHGKFLFTSM